MTKVLTICLFLSVHLFAIELDSPQGQLIEPQLTIEKEEKETLKKWSKFEFYKLYKELLEGNKNNTINLYKIFSLNKFLSTTDEYSDTLISAMNETLKVEEDASLRTKSLVILNKLANDIEDHQRIAWYFYEYLSSQYKTDKVFSDNAKKLPAGNWSYILPDQVYNFETLNETSQNAPSSILKSYSAGADYNSLARMFQRNKSVQNALIIITLSNGAPFGMASEISLQVSKSEESSGEVFIDQRIGLSMKRSLTNAMMALQKRYPKIQAYQKVMISWVL